MTATNFGRHASDCRLTNEGSRRPVAAAKPRTWGVRVERVVRRHVRDCCWLHGPQRRYIGDLLCTAVGLSRISIRRYCCIAASRLRSCRLTRPS